MCIKKYLQILEEPQFDVEAELISVKLTHLNLSPIHICVFYHPPNADSHPTEQLRLSVTNLLNQSNTPPYILLMGDFNFPGITWSGGYGWISTPTYRSSLNKLFLDIINDASLEQFTHQPTHQDSVLVLVFSSHPKISNLDIVPSISDHDAITFDFNIIHKPTSSINQHKVTLYHKGDLQSIKSDLISFGDNFCTGIPNLDLSTNFGRNSSRRSTR